MQWIVKNYLEPLAGRGRRLTVLDVGSAKVDGQPKCYRELFDPKKFDYTGLDMVAGENVDIVAKNPYHFDMIADNSFDIVVSGQAFEHTEFFWITTEEIARVLKPEGYFCMVVPHRWQRHCCPVDCWRFDENGMAAIARYVNFEPLHTSANMYPEGENPEEWCGQVFTDAMLVAKKPKNWTGKIDPKTFEYKPYDYHAYRTNFLKYEDNLYPRSDRVKFKEKQRQAKFYNGE